MFSRILVPLDGSSLAEQALTLAKRLATCLDSTLLLFRAVEPITDVSHDGSPAMFIDEQVGLLKDDATNYLESVSSTLKAEGIRVEHEVCLGHSAAAILEHADKTHTSLIAMTTHGRTGLSRWVYGSVAEKVLTSAKIPVLLQRASCKSIEPDFSRILVPLDGSTLAERALVPAQQLAAAFQSQIILFRQYPLLVYDIANDAPKFNAQEYLRQVTAEIAFKGFNVKWETHFGAPAECILERADMHAVGLIVMSTHGRSGVSRFVMGSVADKVLRASVRPVLMVRAGAAINPN